MIRFYNRDGVCSLRGTDWIFITKILLKYSLHTVNQLRELCHLSSRQVRETFVRKAMIYKQHSQFTALTVLCTSDRGIPSA
jgi:hypothetical protein